MISFLQGTISEVTEDAVVIDHQGIGFLITVPSSVAKQLHENESVTLYTHLMIRETEVALYGFLDAADRRLFLSLQEVSGVGPKQALRILSELPADELRTTILQGESFRLARVKGIGPKTASRIILELQDKMKRLSLAEQSSEGVSSQRRELLMALRVLGYTDQEANRGIDILWQDEANRKLSLENQVKQLLMILSRRSS